MGKITGLTANQAKVVDGLITEIRSHHPKVTGFALKGSAYDPESRLPQADVDINWCGQADETQNDARMGFRKVFQREGVLIDFATWFWSDLSRPETSGLPTAVSLARSEILWECDAAFSEPRRAIRRLLADRDWVTAKLADEFASYRASLEKWVDPAERGPIGSSWDFARHCCTFWGLSVVSCLQMRPPSAGRKGLMETVLRSRELGVPWFGEAILAAMGAESITRVEATAWVSTLDELLGKARRLVANKALSPDTELLSTATYYLAGIQAMIERGFHRESLWPCWRVFHGFADVLAETDAATEAAETVSSLHERVGLTDDESISARLPLVRNAVERLEHLSEPLLDQFFSRLPKTSREWDSGI